MVTPYMVPVQLHVHVLTHNRSALYILIMLCVLLQHHLFVV